MTNELPTSWVWSTIGEVAQYIQRQIPLQIRRAPGAFDPASDTIKDMTMKVSKGRGFPAVALPGVGHMAAKGADEQEAARVFYVAATRATQSLVIGVGGDGGMRLHQISRRDALNKSSDSSR